MSLTAFETALVRHAQRPWLQNLDDHSRADCLAASLDLHEATAHDETPIRLGDRLAARATKATVTMWPPVESSIDWFTEFGAMLLHSTVQTDPRLSKQAELTFAYRLTDSQRLAASSLGEQAITAVKRFMAKVPPTQPGGLATLGIYGVAMACGRRRLDEHIRLNHRFPLHRTVIENALTTSQLVACYDLQLAAERCHHG